MTDGPAAVPLRFEILGPVRAFRGTERVDLGPAKQRAVLAILLLSPGRPVPTHRIVDAVWGDDPPENGPNVVQKYVAGLRRVLEPDRSPRTPGELLTFTDGGYVLRRTTLDADDFQARLARADAERRAGHPARAAATARAALDLWHGEALSGLTGPIFEAARNRLTEEHASAWEMWAETELDRGVDSGLLSELGRLVEQFPLREALRAHLMVALQRSGRQAEALAVFRDAREYFLDQLGAEPGELMLRAHQRILRDEAVYTEAVDPWAGRDVTPQVTVVPMAVSPPAPVPEPPPAFPPPAFPAPGLPAPGLPAPGFPAPGVSPDRPVLVPVQPRQGTHWVEVAAAALLPIVVCTFGSWIWFAWAAAQRRTRHELIAAIAYFAGFLVVVVLLAIDPSPLDSTQLSSAEGAGLTLALALSVTAAVHGAILASHTADSRAARARRELARQFAAADPAGARQAGIGRPDLLRPFDDGGLLDLNHAPVQEIARLAGVGPAAAQRIVHDRYQRGPFATPADLMTRGLLPPATVKRIERWLICVAPG
ncbi:BTAD domain-containing putative transcriptional regulator [Actinoplanes sp. DH11]|uniref:BTAD domain-containing putative transcriptional regulator n=1 Tax=Actinoplanes sp. DH11 TaxID=2857011 RepID=UPI001E4DB89E|nr:BTAD domain-containing putative transcriptional regulator [Actinoplanes sp. DH11]